MLIGLESVGATTTKTTQKMAVMQSRVSFSHKCIAMIIIMTIARWLYDPSFDCDFTFDDHLAVVNNADVDTTKYEKTSHIYNLF